MNPFKFFRGWTLRSLVILLLIIVVWYQVVARDVLPRRDPDNDWFYWVGFAVLAVVILLRASYSIKKGRKALRVRTIDEALEDAKATTNRQALEDIYEEV